MKPQVNIAVVVDVIGALSDKSLLNGNLCMVDDGSFDSTGQGTSELCTVVVPGQVVQWSALAVDLQTPVEIKSITFLGPGDGEDGDRGGDHSLDGDHLDLNVWAGVVPPFMAPGVPHTYQLELQMYEGVHSVLHIDSPALMRL
jgi:hypothetical protein